MPKTATTYASSSSASNSSLPLHPRSLEVESDQALVPISRRSKTRSTPSKQLATRPAIRQRRSTGEEVVLEPNPKRRAKMEVLGRTKMNTNLLMGVYKPYKQITYTVHRDGSREVNERVPIKRIYQLSDIKEGVEIPKAVKYGRMFNMLLGGGDINKHIMDDSASSSSSGDDYRRHRKGGR